MINFLLSVISFLLIFPIVIFMTVFFISLKVNRRPARAFGIAADTTTFILFFAVPIAIQSLFQLETVGIITSIALIISLILTVIEWKSKKEIELLPLLRKIWRCLFLILSLTYIIVLSLGLVLKVLEYVK